MTLFLPPPPPPQKDKQGQLQTNTQIKHPHKLPLQTPPPKPTPNPAQKERIRLTSQARPTTRASAKCTRRGGPWNGRFLQLLGGGAGGRGPFGRIYAVNRYFFSMLAICPCGLGVGAMASTSTFVIYPTKEESIGA